MCYTLQSQILWKWSNKSSGIGRRSRVYWRFEPITFFVLWSIEHHCYWKWKQSRQQPVTERRCILWVSSFDWLWLGSDIPPTSRVCEQRFCVLVFSLSESNNMYVYFLLTIRVDSTLNSFIMFDTDWAISGKSVAISSVYSLFLFFFFIFWALSLLQRLILLPAHIGWVFENAFNCGIDLELTLYLFQKQRPQINFSLHSKFW